MNQGESYKRSQALGSLENLIVIIKSAQDSILDGGYEQALTEITRTFDTQREKTRKLIFELAEIADNTYV